MLRSGTLPAEPMRSMHGARWGAARVRDLRRSCAWMDQALQPAASLCVGCAGRRDSPPQHQRPIALGALHSRSSIRCRAQGVKGLRSVLRATFTGSARRPALVSAGSQRAPLPLPPRQPACCYRTKATPSLGAGEPCSSAVSCWDSPTASQGRPARARRADWKNTRGNDFRAAAHTGLRHVRRVQRTTRTSTLCLLCLCGGRHARLHHSQTGPN